MIPHDDCDGAKRGHNTVRIFRINGLKIAHMGDIGRPLTADEVEKLSGLDCMLIPVGGYYTIDAAQAREIIALTKPKVTIPMHYRSEGIGFDVLSTIEPFVAGLENVEYENEEYLLTFAAPEQQIVVLKPAAASNK
jgi:L-ascorbate metabolism protein UlaG (beta-lactamase superfamily)